MVVTPFTVDDQEKLAAGLRALLKEDETIRFGVGRADSAGIHPFTIAATGEEQLEAIIDRLGREFLVEGRLGKPQIVYDERQGLEPVMLLQITIPKDCLGDILGDLERRRGLIVLMLEQSGIHTVEARVAMAQLIGYRSALQALTRNHGAYQMRFDHYRPIHGGPGGSDADRGSFVGAPRHPTKPLRASSIALPEPDDDALES